MALIPLERHEFEWKHEYVTPHPEEHSRVARYDYLDSHAISCVDFIEVVEVS